MKVTYNVVCRQTLRVCATGYKTKTAAERRAAILARNWISRDYTFTVVEVAK